MEVNLFDTRESILALCLILAGQEPADQVTFNLFDEEILFKIGGGQRHIETKEVIRKSRFAGMSLTEAANESWKEGARGDVGYILKTTPRLLDLTRAYRDQCAELEKSDAKSSEMITEILGAGYEPDEMILRIACVILKTRGDFMNLWKKVVPLLRISETGKAKHFESSVVSEGKTVQAKGVQKPGFRIVSLNASDKTKKALKL